MFAPTVSSDGTPSGLCVPSADSAESRDSATRSLVLGAGRSSVRQGLGAEPARGILALWASRPRSFPTPGRMQGGQRYGTCATKPGTPSPTHQLAFPLISRWLWVKLFPESQFPHW